MTAASLAKRLFPQETWPCIWIVGGSVRDSLLGKTGEDLDLVAALTPEELTSRGFRQVDPVSSAPIWFRHIPAIGKIEVTRIDGEGMLRGDLARRDFTVNALAMSLDGEVIDLFGGIQDLGRKALRACSPESFQDDPVRIFRAFRFEADGWRMECETERMIAEASWEGCFRAIPVERFSREMVKALAGKEPGLFFRRMMETGVGGTYLPELFAMGAVPAGPVERHPEGDLFTHALEVMQRTAAAVGDPLARFCAFFHDLGKLSTDPALYPAHHGHDKAGRDAAGRFCDGLRLPVSWRRALAGTCRLHGHANKWRQLRDSARILVAQQALKAGIADILPLISAADNPHGPGMSGWDRAVGIAHTKTADLGIEQGCLEVIPAKDRAGFILRKRVEMMRGQS